MNWRPLVSTAWVADWLDVPDLRLADCRWYLGEPERGRAEYDAGHLPGAIYVSLDGDLSAPEGPGRHPLPDADAYAAHLAALGFGNDRIVVAYDDSGGAVAARLWWMLRGIGHRRAAVLDGGYAAWRAEGRPVAADPGGYPPDQLTVRTRPRTIDADALAGRLGDVTLIDARDGDRYRGEREPVDPVAGHIPTAVSVPHSGNLRDDGHFTDPAALRRRYEEAGVGAKRATVVYCGSGVTACHDILAIELAGLPNAVLYPGSWSDWGTAGREVATGQDPGTR